MGRHADLAELREDVLGDAVVEHALALDQRVLLVVEGRGIVLEMLNEGAGLGSLVEDLGLALVYTAPPVHSLHPHACVSVGWTGAPDFWLPLEIAARFCMLRRMTRVRTALGTKPGQ